MAHGFESMPGGSYRRSCVNCSYNNGILKCSCTSDDGQVNKATLTTPISNRRVSNCDGNLCSVDCALDITGGWNCR